MLLSMCHYHRVITSCQAIRNGHEDWTDGTLGSDDADPMSEDDFSFVRQAENIVDKSERALAQVSAVLESAAAHNPAIGSYGGIGVDPSGTTSADAPLKKKKVCSFGLHSHELRRSQPNA
jgi:hypothetical protein